MTEATKPVPPTQPTDPTIPIQTISDDDEHLQILRLLENGEITADEADHLLDALDAEPEPSAKAASAAAGAKHQDRSGQSGPRQNAPGATRLPPPRLRIRVSDTTSGKSRVNITIPLGFLDAAYRLARRIVPNRVPDRDSFQSAIRDGFRGHLIDVHEGDEHVEILVE